MSEIEIEIDRIFQNVSGIDSKTESCSGYNLIQSNFLLHYFCHLVSDVVTLPDLSYFASNNKLNHDRKRPPQT